LSRQLLLEEEKIMTKLEKYLSRFDSRVCDTEGCNNTPIYPCGSYDCPEEHCKEHIIPLYEECVGCLNKHITECIKTKYTHDFCFGKTLCDNPNHKITEIICPDCWEDVEKNNNTFRNEWRKK
jgi:hypothetical protein